MGLSSWCGAAPSALALPAPFLGELEQYGAFLLMLVFLPAMCLCSSPDRCRLDWCSGARYTSWQVVGPR